MSSQRANSRAIASWMTGSACSMPPRVSSENTTPKPNVSSGALRSQTVISRVGSSALASAAKYRPPGPPPMTARRTSAGLLPQRETLELAGGRLRQRVDEVHDPWVLVRRDLRLHELLQLSRGLGAPLD